MNDTALLVSHLSEVIPWELGAVILQELVFYNFKNSTYGLMSSEASAMYFGVWRRKSLGKNSKQNNYFKAELPYMPPFFCCGYKENVCILRALHNDFIYLLLGRYLRGKISKEKILFL